MVSGRTPDTPDAPAGGRWTGVAVGTTVLLAAMLGVAAGAGAESGDTRVSRVASVSGSDDRSESRPRPRTVEQARARFVESANRLGVAHRQEDEARAEVDRITRLLRAHDRPPYEQRCALWVCTELPPEQQRANDEWSRATRDLTKAEAWLTDRERVRGRREADSEQRWQDVQRLTSPATEAVEPAPARRPLIDLSALLGDDEDDDEDGGDEDDGDEDDG
jgi:hypothetical protein